MKINPFDSNLEIGSIYHIKAAMVDVNLPVAGQMNKKFYCGHSIGNGEINEFVFIECGVNAIFGRIVELRLPERERLDIETEFNKTKTVHPVASVQLLATVDTAKSEVTVGFTQHPRLGAKVYSAHPILVKWVLEHSQGKNQTETEQQNVSLAFADLPEVDQLDLSMLPEQLFGRHCAVIGTTGGGKSWTVSSLIGSTLKHNAKVILLDATGEYYKLPEDSTTHVYIGTGEDKAEEHNEVIFSYKNLTENDLFAMFSPSGQVQAPKLREAIKSLKLARIKPELASSGLIKKANKSKKPIEDALQENAAEIFKRQANFDIELLSQQITEECVWPSANFGNDLTKWGRANDKDVSFCVSLQMRIDSMIHSQAFNCLFQIGGKIDFCETFKTFWESDDKKILRIGLQNIPFSNNAREIVTNAIGRHLLDKARGGEFKDKPLLIFVDEAHQFLDKSLGDEFTRFKLDAFGLIAKEGRKYGLNVCIATQRPRDIPEDVLSQIGTLIVHRLINDKDRSVVERASGEIDRMSSSFLPSLGPGEAVIVGVDFPIPVIIKVNLPDYKPDSSGPDYQKAWG